jgi:hypothetical protein
LRALLAILSLRTLSACREKASRSASWASSDGRKDDGFETGVVPDRNERIYAVDSVELRLHRPEELPVLEGAVVDTDRCLELASVGRQGVPVYHADRDGSRDAPNDDVR